MYLRKIKQWLHKAQLVGIWSFQHHNARDYTYSSPVHQTYSRIDYFFISQALDEDVVENTIEPIIMSNHAPIPLSLSVSTQPPQNKRWRLNKSILQEVVSKTQLQAELLIFFELNDQVILDSYQFRKPINVTSGDP